MDIKELYNEYREQISAVLKIVTVFSPIVGFVYLLSYTNANGIPIPISLTELPTLLISIFGLGTLFAFLFLGFAFLPALSRIFIAKPDAVGLFGDDYNKNRTIFLYLLAAPLFVFLVTFLSLSIYSYQGVVVAIIVFSSTLVFLWFVQCLFEKLEKQDRLKILGIVIFMLFACTYWMVLWLMVFVKVMLKYLPGVGPLLGMVIIVIFSLLMLVFLYFMIVPASRARPIDKKLVYGLGMFAVFIPVLINPIAVFLAGLSLQVMRVGGGYRAIYTFKKDHRVNLPCQLVNQNFPDQSKILYVILDIGKRIYVKSEHDDPVIYSIPLSDIDTKVYWK